ncbi:hypothetical protein [Streptomyces sp. NPDC001966]
MSTIRTHGVLYTARRRVPVRHTGFSFLAVEVEPGPHARMKVAALAESGERIDHFGTGRGRPVGPVR